MKQGLLIRTRRMLVVFLIGALLAVSVGIGFGTAVGHAGADPERASPATVMPGDVFQVTVTFTSPANESGPIGLTDFAPAGWTVRVDKAWCTPPANAARPAVAWDTDRAEYIWFGPFAAGVAFTVVYEVQVPSDAHRDTYEFPGGTLEYYIAGAGPNVEAIGGDYEVVIALYDLTIDSTEGGSVTTPGEGAPVYTYEPGEVVGLVAEADPCYEFVNWTGDIADIDDPESATTTITMLDDYSITANFVLIQYDLTVGSTEGGSVTVPGEGTYTQDCGTEVTLKAEADECYEFTGWTGAVADPNSLETTITVNDEYAVTANFALIQYDLTAGSTEGGSVTVPGQGTFPRGCGTMVDLLAVADECYEFTGWTGDIADIDDPESATTTITMLDDYSITANFVLIQYDLTVGSTEGGAVTVPGEGTYTQDCGTEVTLKAEADAGYEFVEWTGDTDEIDGVTSADTFITVLGDYSITATFALIRYDLTVGSTAGGSVTDPGEGTYTYDHGTEVDLKAEAEAGYEFTGWTGDIAEIDDATSADTFVTMSGDYSITAEFIGLASIQGETREVDCEVLPGVTITLLRNGTMIGATESDGDGKYELALGYGDYTVVASKAGFMAETRGVATTGPDTYTVDFFGDHGLIPNAPLMSYVLRCINLWIFGEEPCKLEMSKVLAVISAWQFQI